MAAYVKVADAADLPPGRAMAVTVADKRIALFAVDGILFAIDDTCTHRGGPLSEGELKDGIVTCPWHGASGPASRDETGLAGAGCGDTLKKSG
jgi:nitrite reductase/ring-hydroxylating ferredoxin subunit